MSLGVSTIWDVRNGGSDSTCGGGFNPANANFATDLTTDANTGNTSSPVVSSASYNFVAGDVGHWVYVKSGTNWYPGWYQIASVASNKATLSAATGSGFWAFQTQSSSNVLVPVRVSTAAGVASVGTPTAGTWGIDYTQANSARLAFTDMNATGGTTTFASAGNPVGKNFIGNVVKVTGGTSATTGFYEVVSTSGTTATLDRAWTSSTATANGAGGLGGGFASPGYGSAQVAAAAGGVLFLKYNATDYSISSASLNVSGGRVQFDTDAKLIGYDAARTILNADANRPTMKATTAITSFIDWVNAFSRRGWFRNVVFNGNSLATNVHTTTCGDSQWFDSCVGKNCTGTAFGLAATNTYSLCEAFGNTIGFECQLAEWCYSHDNTTHGFKTSSSYFFGCIANSNGGAGFQDNGFGSNYFSCVAYGNTGNGFEGQIDNRMASNFITSANCISYGNGGYGFVGGENRVHRNCADGSNTSGSISGDARQINCFTLSANPFVDAPNGNFALNTAPGGGAACRTAGYPGVFPGGLTTGYADVGAAQHQDSGGTTPANPLSLILNAPSSY